MKFVRAVSFAVLSTAVLAGCSSDLTTPAEVSEDASYAISRAIVGSVEVTPSTVTVAPGAKVTLAAVVKDKDGNVLADRSVGWSTSDRAIAKVSTSGVVTGVAVGTVTITATSAEKSGSAVVTVGTGESVGGTTSPDPTPAPAPEPTPESTSTTGSGVSHNFEDGTFGPFQPAGNGGALDVVADPTGSGKGKVLRIRYTLTANPDKKILSADRALGLWNMGIGFKQTRFFRGDFYVPAPSDDNRKLLRFDMKNSPAGNYLVVALWGTKLRVEGYSKGAMEWFSKDLGSYAGDRWHTLEVQVTTNSAVGVRDGILRIWMDGSLVYEKTNSLWLDAGDSVATMRFGEQLSISGNSSRDEYRYWDNVRFTTSR